MIELPIEDKQQLEIVSKALKNQTHNADFVIIRTWLEAQLMELDRNSRRITDHDEACRSQGARIAIQEFLEVAADADAVLKRMSAT